jgi:hypothetical protein
MLKEQALAQFTEYFDIHCETVNQFAKESLENFQIVKERNIDLYKNPNNELEKKFIDLKSNQQTDINDLKNIHDGILNNLNEIKRKAIELEFEALAKRI